MTMGCIPYLRSSKRNRKRGTNVDLSSGPAAKLQRLRLCQDNEATESQRAIHLGIGIRRRALLNILMPVAAFLDRHHCMVTTISMAVWAQLGLVAQSHSNIRHRLAILPRSSAVVLRKHWMHSQPWSTGGYG